MWKVLNPIYADKSGYNFENIYYSFIWESLIVVNILCVSLIPWLWIFLVRLKETKEEEFEKLPHHN
jgi:hypothetical protein